MRSRMSIAIVRATHLCIRESRIPTMSQMRQHPQWEDGAGLSLFHHEADNKLVSKMNTRFHEAKSDL